ncbi:phage tail tape measure protein [Chengkuizengella marina]|uniref:Phage-related minor tail protein n=1 Tax=Chengkuizengella marina TaxID=2507566 RepID=A0A6N9Q825_9BACL|nr:hypothetical protein [Chengkuizengella marina]NBI30900.1 hypothetical protein [Chengkuizengella marina]
MGAKDISKTLSLKDRVSGTLKKISKETVTYKKNLRNLKQSANSAWSAVKVGAAAGAVAATSAAVGFATLTNSMMDYAFKVDKFSQVMGMTRKEYQQWDYVMKQVGYSAEQANGDLAALGEKAMDAANGVGEGAEFFGMLGLQVTDTSGKLKSQEQIFSETITALQGMEDVTKRNAIASALLSTTGEELVPILNMTAEELEKMKSKANVIDDRTIENSKKFKTSIKDLKTGLMGMSAELIGPALPYFNSGIQWVIDNIPTAKAFMLNAFNGIKQVIAENAGVLYFLRDSFLKVYEGAAYVYHFIADNWSFISPVIWGIVGALTAYNLITKAIAMKTALWTAAQWALNVALNANPIGLVVMAIGSLIAVGVTLVKNWDKVEMAGQKLWNGMVGGAEWMANSVVKGINWMVEKALGPINNMIDGLNNIHGVNIKPIAFGGLDEVSFGATKFSMDDPMTVTNETWKNYAQGNDNTGIDQPFTPPEIETNTDVLKGMTAALQENTSTMKSTKGGGPTFYITINGSDLTAEEIADKLVPRIQRKLFT